jgi:hypothetical protein
MKHEMTCHGLRLASKKIASSLPQYSVQYKELKNELLSLPTRNLRVYVRVQARRGG